MIRRLALGLALACLGLVQAWAQQPVAQSGTWNVRAQDGAGNAQTSNSTILTGKFALDVNILQVSGVAPTVFTSNSTTYSSEVSLDSNFLGTLGTAFNVAGKVDTLSYPTTQSTAALTAKLATSLTSGTAGVSLKTTAGNVYGFAILPGSTASCWLEFINSTGAGTLGTGVIFSIPLTASTALNFIPGAVALSNFSSGIAVGVVTTAGGATACATASNVTVFYE